VKGFFGWVAVRLGDVFGIIITDLLLHFLILMKTTFERAKFIL
jgi:integral membrane sensor domain MASE1